ncbi:MAG: PAS domain S-box protein, partial [Gloeomargarita sp. HHBFW_bins_162]
AAGECLGVWERQRWLRLQQGYDLWQRQTIDMLMNPRIVTVSPEMPIAQVRALLSQSGDTGVMVVRPETPRLALGWVDWRDLVQAGTTVQEVMRPPQRLPATTTLYDAYPYRHEWVLVTDAAGLVVGCLTPQDWQRYEHPWHLQAVLADLRQTITQQAEQVHNLTTSLRRNQERFSALLRYCGDVIVVVNAQGIITYCSPSVRTVLGYDLDDLLGQLFCARIHPEERAVSEDILTRTTTDLVQWEFRYQRQDGTWCDLEAVGNPQYQDPNLRGMVLNLRDVGERKQTLHLLTQKHAELRGVFRALRDRYYRFDSQGQILDCLDTCSPEHLGQKITDVLPPAAREPLAHALSKIQQGTEFTQFRYHHDHQTWAARLVPLPQQQAILVVQNITPQTQLENALQAIVQIQNWLLATENPQTVYDRILQKLGETVGVSRVYIFENHQGEQGQILADQKAEWCAPGVRPELDNPLLQNWDYVGMGFGRWLEVLSRGEAIYGVVADLPPAERDFLALQDIFSILVVPLKAGEELYGFIGFDACNHVRHWQETEVNLLASVGTAVAQSLRQWRLDRAVQDSEEKYRQLLEASSDAIWVSDAQTGRLVEVSPQAEVLSGQPRAQLIGRYQWELHPRAEQATMRQDFFYWVQMGGTGERGVPAQVQQRDGQTVPVEITARLFTWRGRSLLRSAVRDVRQRLQWEATQQVLLEAMPLGVAIIRRRQLRLVNPALCHILGYGRTELESLPPQQLMRLVHRDDRPKLRQAYRRWQKKGGIQVAQELRVWHRDGMLLHLECYGQPLLVQGQTAVHVTIKDVTENRRMAQALQQSLEQFRLTFERSPAAMSITDVEGQFLRVNPALCDLLGYEAETLLSADCKNFIHPDDQEVYEQVNTQLLRDEVPQMTLELRLCPQPGRTLYVLLSKVVIARNRDGEPVLLLSQLVNVTDRVMAQQSLRRSEARLKLAAQTAGMLVWEWDMATDVTETSRYSQDAGLYPPEEPLTLRLPGLTVMQHVHPEDLPEALAIRQRYQRGEIDRVEHRHRILVADGTCRWIQSTSQLIRDETGQPVRVVGVSLDITEQMNLLQAVQTSEERLRTVVEDQTELIYRAKANGELTFVNPAFCRYAGRTEAELINQPFTHRFHPQDQERFNARLQALTAGTPTFTMECRTQTSPERWYEWTIRGLFDAQERLWEVQGIGRDITEKKLAEAQLLHEALHDPLTGLPNRTLFLDRLQQVLARYQRERQGGFAVLFVDLDRFKVVNDSLGHQAGDKLLVTIAQRLRSVVRAGDTVARLGGDEFALLLTPFTPEQVANRLPEIQQVIAQPTLLAGQNITSPASIGVVFSHPSYQTPEELLRDADIAMYRAKNQGRGCYVIFASEMFTQAMADLRWERELRTALAENQFQVYYQPIVATSGETLGVEALVRWHHPAQGVLLPEQFLP